MAVYGEIPMAAVTGLLKTGERKQEWRERSLRAPLPFQQAAWSETAARSKCSIVTMSGRFASTPPGAGCRATMAERAAGDQRSHKLISFVSILLIDAAGVEARNE
jgi:hypothetical protein